MNNYINIMHIITKIHFFFLLNEGKYVSVSQLKPAGHFQIVNPSTQINSATFLSDHSTICSLQEI